MRTSSKPHNHLPQSIKSDAEGGAADMGSMSDVRLCAIHIVRIIGENTGRGKPQGQGDRYEHEVTAQRGGAARDKGAETADECRGAQAAALDVGALALVVEQCGERAREARAEADAHDGQRRQAQAEGRLGREVPGEHVGREVPQLLVAEGAANDGPPPPLVDVFGAADPVGLHVVPYTGVVVAISRDGEGGKGAAAAVVVLAPYRRREILIPFPPHKHATAYEAVDDGVAHPDG